MHSKKIKVPEGNKKVRALLKRGRKEKIPRTQVREFLKCVGVRIDADGNEIPVKDEIDHFWKCECCGQLVDMRNLMEVLYHMNQEDRHEPLIDDS
jgi:hypothetical protein